MAKLKKDGTPRKPPCVHVTKKRFLKALKGTGGVKSRIAENLDCTWGVVQNCLLKKGWEDIVAAYEEECEDRGDRAENAVDDAIDQRKDMKTSARTARWYLEQKHSDRGYGNKVEHSFKKGVHPLHVEEKRINIDSLDLPIDVKKQVLYAIEKKEAEDDARRLTRDEENDKGAS
jgi:hypothetical protein